MTTPAPPTLEDAFRSLHYLNSRDCEQILQLSLEQPFAAGDVLLRQGAAASDFIILIRGQADVRIQTGAGPLDVDVLGPGNLVGEMSFITGEPVSATVVGREAGLMLRIPHSVLEGLCQQEWGFGTRLYQSLALLLARRLRQTSTRNVSTPPR